MKSRSVNAPAREKAEPDHSIAEGDPVYGPLNRMLRLAYDEGDRSFALSMAVFTEKALRELLLSYLRPSKGTTGLIDGFNAPLGTLSARIRACAAIGLLTATQRNDLELCRKVRNTFAHGWEPRKFDDPDIAALVRSMSGDRTFGRECKTMKSRFFATMFSVLAEAQALRQQLWETNTRIPVIARHLRALDG